VEKLLAQAPADKIVHTQYFQRYAHCDFVWAPNAKVLLYPDVLKVLVKYAATSKK
jgi:hypothetical protein